MSTERDGTWRPSLIAVLSAWSWSNVCRVYKCITMYVCRNFYTSAVLNAASGTVMMNINWTRESSTNDSNSAATDLLLPLHLE